MGTIITGLVLIGIVAAVIMKIRRDKKASFCSCAHAGSCDLCKARCQS